MITPVVIIFCWIVEPWTRCPYVQFWLRSLLAEAEAFGHASRTLHRVA
ncbi:hypothetical protein [Moorena sp. SIO4G3]|nr:hypothetical protein [Moorena sp. SIO4G3]NEO80001.1 hypothetical protein [Moorena sp. SIO4G3]